MANHLAGGVERRKVIVGLTLRNCKPSLLLGARASSGAAVPACRRRLRPYTFLSTCPLPGFLDLLITQGLEPDDFGHFSSVCLPLIQFNRSFPGHWQYQV